MSWWGEKQDAAAREGHPAPPSWGPRKVRARFGGVLCVAVAGLLLLAPVAFAVPPANDKFEDAKVLGPALPVLVPGSNVDATKESSGEPYDVFAAGHSVWFSWTAPSDEVVTIDTCNSEFATRLTVFTGPSIGSLTEVGYDSNSDGRSCPDAAGVTFRAKGGTAYSVLVDGDAFSFPESPPPITEGLFELKIAATPSPPNDMFEDATTLEGHVTEEPGGARPYYAWARGYNWNATKEAGEPDHGGDPGGASVWYDWTAPASGMAEVDACESINSLLGVYTGDSVGALAPVAGVPMALFGSPKVVPCNMSFDTGAGVTYRIAVDGKLDTGSGQSWSGGFGIHVAMQLPRRSASAGGDASATALVDKTPPETTIRKRVLRSQPPQLVFHFSSNEPGSTFRCKLDKHRYAKCHSPKRFRHLEPGSHTLKVFAIDPAGNADPSPAIAHFTFPSNVKAHSRR